MTKPNFDHPDVTDTTPKDGPFGLPHTDWLFDGCPIRGEVMIKRFGNLDWSKASVDLGPSIAGNLGPYWHVPLGEVVIDGEVYALGDTGHRLYPRLLTTRWAALVHGAVKQYADEQLLRANRRPPEYCAKCRREVAEVWKMQIVGEIK